MQNRLEEESIVLLSGRQEGLGSIKALQAK